MDYGSLQQLYNFKELEGQMARWLEAIQEFDFDIVHHKGRLNSDADALSRAPCEQCRQEPLHHQDYQTSLVATTVIAVQLDDHIAQLQSEDPVLDVSYTSCCYGKMFFSADFLPLLATVYVTSWWSLNHCM